MYMRIRLVDEYHFQKQRKFIIWAYILTMTEKKAWLLYRACHAGGGRPCGGNSV